MKKTQINIIKSAIQLFNEQGISNVRLQDIAKTAGISPGNLSYHYRLKKDLMVGILEYMKIAFVQSQNTNLFFLETNDYGTIIRNYIRFQIEHRFFYRDILDIIALVPDAKSLYEKQIERVVNFSKNGLYLAVGKGIIKPEPHEGHFHFFAKNAWAILNSWLTEREVLGNEKVSLQHAFLAMLEFYYPYFTEDKGKEWYEKMKQDVVRLISSI